MRCQVKAIACSGLGMFETPPQGVLLRPGRRAPVCSQRREKGVREFGEDTNTTKDARRLLSSRVEGRG